MKCRSDWVETDGGERFQAYVSLPESPNGKAVVILQEIFGVTKTVRSVADRYAAEGYVAIAPDLFWRIEPGIELSYSSDDVKKAFGYLKRFSEDAAVGDIRSTVDHLHRKLGIADGVAVVGLCLGGKLAYLAAARMAIDAAVVFYGTGIEKNLNEAAAIKCPLLMHFGGQDKFASPEVVQQISTAVEGNRQVQIFSYEEADHGFYTRGAPEISGLAHRRTTEFLNANLSRE